MNKKDEQVKEFLNTYIIPVFAIILLLLLIVFLFIPKYQSITATFSNIGVIDTNTNILNKNIETLKKASKDDVELNTTIANYELIIPTSGKSSELISQLEGIARNAKYGSTFFVSAKANENIDASGKTIPSQNQQNISTIKPPAGINSTDMILDVEGPIANIHTFTQEILKQSRLITINDIKWKSEDSNKYIAIYYITAYFADRIKTAPLPSTISDEALTQEMNLISIPLYKR